MVPALPSTPLLSLTPFSYHSFSCMLIAGFSPSYNFHPLSPSCSLCLYSHNAFVVLVFVSLPPCHFRFVSSYLSIISLLFITFDSLLGYCLVTALILCTWESGYLNLAHSPSDSSVYSIWSFMSFSLQSPLSRLVPALSLLPVLNPPASVQFLTSRNSVKCLPVQSLSVQEPWAYLKISSVHYYFLAL